ncbi:acyl-CoA thioester hydrolase [Candidatus Pantoea symbiotica]|jgi:acyl-CoA thioester hydrolase|uniref:Acyl-CoA thioester hydrolase n=1 Tax=Candidatus Pantoea symbiotica TaxID=1884370 RepID=A0A1I3YF64_9GAMM|nr:MULTISPECIES: thioesterase family protein [Pantoea]KAJ9430347.1 acyl-CoA thioesterase [Pantoea sp. YR343]MRT25654.1 acyl-CoA thioesterase [Enterobacteriaceae bacterium RIT697]SFK30455.1 acyl-CoA thioester hydrolase [Pantoea symbiotica]SFU85158.1 acyl-CoA thioester hydrolase [Pantoea sp. YR525]
MFTKQYEVDEKHIDFQGVVDGLYYPFYMEWTRHAYMREALGIDMEEEFKQGKIYMVLEYSLRFRKSLVKGDKVEVTCELAKNEKRNRVNFVQQILVNGVVYADATFVATCLQNGRPSMPDAVMNALADA